MTTLNDQFQKFLDMQKEALEPMRAFNGLAADTFERLSRQNYAVLGDWMEFAVEQARLPARTTDVNDYLTRQAEFTRAFGEKLVRRSQEYAEITGAFTARAQAATQEAVSAATKVA